MKLVWIGLLFGAGLFMYACHTPDSSKSSPATIKQDSTQYDSETVSASCSAKPIKDPNHPKPMALMMRQMVSFADSMRADLLAGKIVQAEKYPLLHFHLVEPTDKDVLQPEFFENARQFQLAWKALYKTKGNQTKAYNAVISKCVQCHTAYCSGPLKRINKLPIP